jgi:hypothetical protein
MASDREVERQEEWYRALQKESGRSGPASGPQNVVSAAGETPPRDSRRSSTTDPAQAASASAPHPPKQAAPTKADGADFAPVLEELDAALKCAIRRSLRDPVGKVGGVGGAENVELAGGDITATQKYDGESGEDSGRDVASQKGEDDSALAPSAASSVVEGELGSRDSDGEESYSDEDSLGDSSSSTSTTTSGSGASSSTSGSGASSTSGSGASSTSGSCSSHQHQGTWGHDDEELFASAASADSSLPLIAVLDDAPQQQQPPPLSASSSTLLGQLHDLGFCDDDAALLAIIDRLRRSAAAATDDDDDDHSVAAVTAQHVLREYVRHKTKGAP